MSKHTQKKTKMADCMVRVRSSWLKISFLLQINGNPNDFLLHPRHAKGHSTQNKSRTETKSPRKSKQTDGSWHAAGSEVAGLRYHVCEHKSMEFKIPNDSLRHTSPRHRAKAHRTENGQMQYRKQIACV
ncbi:hypothetical protein D1007_60460 [Hordeum vulgare]|nr:hypothetical protein D1007_60460 [Hordeum vulgare]